jgi:putative spermidine/putrescine transport system permease protein
VEAADALASAPKRSVGRRLADLFHGRPGLQVGTLLAGPIGWLVIGYLGSLAVLLVAAFWGVDPLSGEVVRSLTLGNFKDIFNEPVYWHVIRRTLLIAALVTLTDALLAFPIAFYMAKLASRRAKGILVVAVLMPLWSFYLVKVYAWRIILSDGGVLNWALDPFGISGPGLQGTLPVFLTEAYLWLPFMILPIYAGLERIPDSLLSASEDLGAQPWTTFRRVILPLAFPAVVAGSIFTFSLTLGDYITPQLVSSTQFIGNVIFTNVTNNRPFASALAIVPIVAMIVYLLLARRLGAFEQL